MKGTLFRATVPALSALLLAGCVTTGSQSEVQSAGPSGYPYRTWKLDAALDKVCAIPGATAGNKDEPAQRALRLVRGVFVDTAILHYGVSRIGRYSEHPQADAVALLTSAKKAIQTLDRQWGRREDPQLYELGKADIIHAAASLAARAIEPTRDELRSFLAKPTDLDTASDLVVGALEVAMYSRAYYNDCNRLMHGLGAKPELAQIKALARLYAAQMKETCQRGAQLAELGGTNLCAEAGALEQKFSGQ